MTAPFGTTPLELELGRFIDERAEALALLKEVKLAMEEQSANHDGEQDDFGISCGGCFVPMKHSLHCRLSNLVWKLERSRR